MADIKPGDRVNGKQVKQVDRITDTFVRVHFGKDKSAVIPDPKPPKKTKEQK